MVAAGTLPAERGDDFQGTCAVPAARFGSAERGRWNADHPDDDRAQVPGSGGDR